jgi:2-amino-4-hydroxy-6-hydroxymethyldihydropteridine diphosphokinase
MNRAVIGVGSNIEPDTNIAKAKVELVKQFCVLAESEVVETAPVGFTNQANFKNGTVLLETPLSRDGVTKILKGIELNLGREPGGERYGPRTIDLDVVVWNDRLLDPDFYTRDFLRDAVLAVLPDFENP